MIARERHLHPKPPKPETPKAIREGQISLTQPDGVERSAPIKPFEPIVRERVIQKFRSAAEYRVTLVVAPAGFGKSVAVRHYLEQDEVPYLRLAQRQEHETLLGFLTGFATAIADIAPEGMNELYSVYETASSSRNCVADVAAWLSRLLVTFHGVIVIDDLHLTSHDPRIAELVTELVERSTGSKWILITRDASSIATASWIGYGLLGTPIVASDLKVTIAEAGLIAERSETILSTAELSELLELTQAWPVALAFSLHGASQTSDMRALASGTREMVYAFLADQVLRTLDKTDRDFLFATALFPTLDLDLLRSAGFSEPAASVESVRRSTAFVSMERRGTFRYHDLFRDFLDDQLRLCGKDVYSAACGRAASLLVGSGNFIAALELYSRAGLASEAMVLLEEIALDLADTYRHDLVEGSLRWLERSNEPITTKIGALLAYVKRSRGEYAEADRLFRHAIDSAVDPEMRVELSLRYAALLAYPTQRYSEALAVIDSGLACGTVDPLLHARLRARRALLLSYLGYGDEASALADLVLSEVCTIDPLSRTRLSAESAVARVALNCERFEMAADLAREVARKAEDVGSSRFVHSALCILAQASYDQGKIAECNSVLERVHELAERTGVKEIRHYHLAVSYDLAMTLGDSEAITKIEKLLGEESEHDLDSIASLGVVYGLRAARGGNFQEAYEIASRSKFATVDAHQLMNSAKLLVYSAAAGMTDEATALLTSVNADLSKRLPRNESFIISQVRAFIALGALLLDHPASCASQLGLLDKYGSRRYAGISCLTRCIQGMQIHRETGSDSDDVATAIANLRKSALGGYANMLEHIAFTSAGSAGSFAVLTKTELSVLKLLGTGATSRQIAASTGRSALTIDTHVKAIARKLNCKGRREAVVIGRLRGIL